MIVTFCGHGKEEYGEEIRKKLYETIEALMRIYMTVQNTRLLRMCRFLMRHTCLFDFKRLKICFCFR